MIKQQAEIVLFIFAGISFGLSFGLLARIGLLKARIEELENALKEILRGCKRD